MMYMHDDCRAIAEVGPTLAEWVPVSLPLHPYPSSLHTRNPIPVFVSRLHKAESTLHITEPVLYPNFTAIYQCCYGFNQSLSVPQ